MMVMISASHFLTLYLGLELMSLCLYSLVALDRDSAVSTEAAMKYFVLGALASGLLLYGMSMIYGATGSLQIGDVAKAAARLLQGEQPSKAVLAFGLVFVVFGSRLQGRRGAVPHVDPGRLPRLPSAVALFISTGPKLAAFAMAVRLLVNGAARARFRLATHARDPVGAVDGDRQPRRHRAEQHQAHARLLDHLAHGLHAARPALGRGGRKHALGAGGVERGDVLTRWSTCS